MNNNNYRTELAALGWIYEGQCGVCSIRKYKFSHPDYKGYYIRVIPSANKFEVMQGSSSVMSGSLNDFETKITTL